MDRSTRGSSESLHRMKGSIEVALDVISRSLRLGGDAEILEALSHAAQDLELVADRIDAQLRGRPVGPAA